MRGVPIKYRGVVGDNGERCSQAGMDAVADQRK